MDGCLFRGFVGSLYLLVLFPPSSPSPGSFLQGQGHGVSPVLVAFLLSSFFSLSYWHSMEESITFECRAEGVASRDRLRSRNGILFYFMILGYQYRIFNSSLCAAFLSLIKVEPFFIAIDSNSVQRDLLAIQLYAIHVIRSRTLNAAPRILDYLVISIRQETHITAPIWW